MRVDVITVLLEIKKEVFQSELKKKEESSKNYESENEVTNLKTQLLLEGIL